MNKKKKILLITDDIRVHSGTAQIGRELVINTAYQYDWVQIAGAINHPEKGKKLDLSSEVDKFSRIEGSSVTLYPSDGYGNPDFLRKLIKIEKPDALLLITDPRYFEWVFNMESEIRKQLPIIYLNIWDDMPVPQYNREFYESCDLLLSISKQTKLINKLVLEGGEIPYRDLDTKKFYEGNNQNRKAPILIKYLPHGLNSEIFKPLKGDDSLLNKLQQKIGGGKKYDFTLLFNSRNIRRKAIPDTILAWKLFKESLPTEKQDKVRFILHTDAVDNNGTDLPELISFLFPKKDDNIIISPSKISSEEMNVLYNIADAVILLSSNEGWGLSLTESLLSGTPFIANVTGGMQDQMRFEEKQDNSWFTPSIMLPSNNKATLHTHGEWAFPVFPSNLSLVGSPSTPYIFDDRCSSEDAFRQIMKVYTLSNQKRKEIGVEGREWAVGNEAGFCSKIMSERAISAIEELFNTWKIREKYEIYQDTDFKPRVLNHELVY